MDYKNQQVSNRQKEIASALRARIQALRSQSVVGIGSGLFQNQPQPAQQVNDKNVSFFPQHETGPLQQPYSNDVVANNNDEEEDDQEEEVEEDNGMQDDEFQQEGGEAEDASTSTSQKSAPELDLNLEELAANDNDSADEDVLIMNEEGQLVETIKKSEQPPPIPLDQQQELRSILESFVRGSSESL